MVKCCKQITKTHPTTNQLSFPKIYAHTYTQVPTGDRINVRYSIFSLNGNFVDFAQYSTLNQRFFTLRVHISRIALNIFSIVAIKEDHIKYSLILSKFDNQVYIQPSKNTFHLRLEKKFKYFEMELEVRTFMKFSLFHVVHYWHTI